MYCEGYSDKVKEDVFWKRRIYGRGKAHCYRPWYHSEETWFFSGSRYLTKRNQCQQKRAEEHRQDSKMNVKEVELLSRVIYKTYSMGQGYLSRIGSCHFTLSSIPLVHEVLENMMLDKAIDLHPNASMVLGSRDMRIETE